MRRLFPLLLAIVAAVGVMAGCGSRAADQSGDGTTLAAVSEKEAEEAFQLSFVVSMISSMAAAFGQPFEGTTVDYDTGAIGFEDFQVTALEIPTPYTTVSGTATPRDDSMVVSMQLTGGPVSTIAYEITGNQLMTNDLLRITVRANGRDYALELKPDEMLE